MWLCEIGGQMIGVTSACISLSSFTVFKVRLTTSYVLCLLLAEPNVLRFNVSFWITLSCNVSFRCFVIYVLDEPVSISMRAEQFVVVGPLDLTNAVCMIVFFGVVLVDRDVKADLWILVFLRVFLLIPFLAYLTVHRLMCGVLVHS